MTAITPAQAIRASSTDVHISRVNTALAGEWSDVDMANGMDIHATDLSVSAREQIEADFRAAGWGVTYIIDRRDGAFLRFRP